METLPSRGVGAGTLSDGELVRACRTAEEWAWSELVERFSRYVNAIASGAYRLTDSEAEDVFQEVFARAYERLDSLRDDDAIKPWIGQLTRRLCIDRIRGGGREVGGVDELIEAQGDVDGRLNRIEQAMVVHAAMKTLPDSCHEVLDRFFARDQSYQQIASVTGLTMGTIASRMSRCLDKLRGQLADLRA